MNLTFFPDFGNCTVDELQSVGDGYCNDDTNTMDCYNDGNDCCLGSQTKTYYCDDCHCLAGTVLLLCGHNVFGVTILPQPTELSFMMPRSMRRTIAIWEIGLEMDFVMTMQTQLTATLMEVIVVVKMWLFNFAQNATASTQVLEIPKALSFACTVLILIFQLMLNAIVGACSMKMGTFYPTQWT